MASGYEKNALSVEESVVLDRFFRALIKEAEAGYVLYDQKPVCAHAFFSKDLFLVNSPWHANSVALKEGAPIWKHLSTDSQNSKFSIFINDKEEPRLPGWIHLFVINRPLFLNTVKENLPLFQYVLGPSVTPEKLLMNFSSSFASTLHEDKVLIGLILGYGIENALHVSRFEYIFDYLQAAEYLPFKHTEAVHQDPFRGFCLPPPRTRYAFKEVTPSDGFETLKEELDALENKINIRSERLETILPQFIFGHLNDINSGKLVSKLEKAQNKIIDFLNSDKFLQNSIKSFLNKEIKTSNSSYYRLYIDQKEVNKIIARGIWQEELRDCNKEDILDFIKELKAIDAQDKEDALVDLSILKNIDKAQKNLCKTSAFFDALEKQQEVNCIMPHNLYYRILENGCDETICLSPKVRINYSFFDPLGRTIHYQPDISINLNLTVPGFAHAIKGMYKGETREVYIHPSLAYGLYTPYEKGIFLKAIISLIDVENSNEPFSDLSSVDISFIEDENFLKEVRERQKKSLIWRAHIIGAHLRKSKDVDIEMIQKNLQELWQGKELFSMLTPAEENLINKVHWNIYFGT